jgi:hypothetical protein
MARIKIKDLPKDQKISKKDLKEVFGGFLGASITMQSSPISQQSSPISQQSSPISQQLSPIIESTASISSTQKII